MRVTMNRVPAALTGDAAEVVEALDVARALWDKGDRAEAVRFVKRAAQAAEQAGSASRVIALARAADELANASLPPPAPAAPVSETKVGQRPVTAPPPPRATKPPPAPAPSVRPPKSVAPPPPASSPSLSAHTPSAVRAVRPTPAPSVATGQPRIRVSVRTSVRDSALLVVRPLPEGQSAPPGTREAFLVMADVAGDVSNGSNG